MYDRRLVAFTLSALLVLSLTLLSNDDPYDIGPDGAKDDVLVYALCIEPSKAEYPSWCELWIRTDKVTSLKGYSFADHDGTIYKFASDFPVKKNEFVLVCFYKGDKISAEFLESIPKTVNVVNVFNNKTFIEMSTLPKTEKYTIKQEAMKDYDKGVKEFDEYFKSADKSAKPFPFSGYDQIILKLIDPLLYTRYEPLAKEYCLKNGIPEKYKDILVCIRYGSPIYKNELALLDDKEQPIEYLHWGGFWDESDIVSEYPLFKKANRNVQGLTLYRSMDEGFELFFPEEEFREMKKERLGPDADKINYYPMNIGFKRIYNSTQLRNYSEVLGNPYHIGLIQPIDPIKKAHVWTTIGEPLSEKRVADINIGFDFSYRDPFKWGLQIEFASDNEFKDILYTKDFDTAETGEGRDDGFNLKIPINTFKNICKLEKMFFRIRRILPDSYKTDWFVGETTEFKRSFEGDHSDNSADEEETVEE